MVVSASTFGIVVFAAIVVVLGILAAGALGRLGTTASRVGPTGDRVPEPPGLRKPPDEGGLL